MRVIAATFSDEEAADRVLDELRTRYQLTEDDARLAPLGALGPDSADAMVLAGHFADERTPSVCELVERNGGQVVMNVDEAATKRRLTQHGEPEPNESSPRRSRLLPRRERTGVFY